MLDLPACQDAGVVRGTRIYLLPGRGRQPLLPALTHGCLCAILNASAHDFGNIALDHSISSCWPFRLATSRRASNSQLRCRRYAAGRAAAHAPHSNLMRLSRRSLLHINHDQTRRMGESGHRLEMIASGMLMMHEKGIHAP